MPPAGPLATTPAYVPLTPEEEAALAAQQGGYVPPAPEQQAVPVATENTNQQQAQVYTPPADPSYNRVATENMAQPAVVQSYGPAPYQAEKPQEQAAEVETVYQGVASGPEGDQYNGGAYTNRTSQTPNPQPAVKSELAPAGTDAPAQNYGPPDYSATRPSGATLASHPQQAGTVFSPSGTVNANGQYLPPSQYQAYGPNPSASRNAQPNPRAIPDPTGDS